MQDQSTDQVLSNIAFGKLPKQHGCIFMHLETNMLHKTQEWQSKKEGAKPLIAVRNETFGGSSQILQTSGHKKRVLDIVVVSYTSSYDIYAGNVYFHTTDV